MAKTNLRKGWDEYKDLAGVCAEVGEVYQNPIETIVKVGYALEFIAEAMAGRPDESDKSITSVACDGLSVIMRALHGQLDMARMAIKTRATPELEHDARAEEEVAQ